jgi:hypothetical protein
VRDRYLWRASELALEMAGLAMRPASPIESELLPFAATDRNSSSGNRIT